MSDFWVSLADLPEQGQEFEITEQKVWMVPIREFKIPVRITKNLQASFFIFPGQDGYLIKGALRGSAMVPCDRCSAEEEIEIETAFELFEEAKPSTKNDIGEQGFLRFSQGFPELNAGAMLWEQFLLTLPVKHLCSAECQGLCPKCGHNLNISACSCDLGEQDPRMAVFRNLKIKKR